MYTVHCAVCTDDKDEKKQFKNVPFMFVLLYKLFFLFSYFSKLKTHYLAIIYPYNFLVKKYLQ